MAIMPFTSCTPPIILQVVEPLVIVPPLSWTLAIVYTLQPKFPEMLPATFRLLVTVRADIVVMPVAGANVKNVLPAAEGYPPSL